MNPANPIWDTTAPLEKQTVLAEYVQETLPEIHALTRQAESHLGSPTQDRSFDAYVSRDPARVRKQVEAIYETLRSRGLNYRVEAPGLHPPRQAIRLPGTVLATTHGHGCCVDLVLLLASALYSVRLFPLIVVVGTAAGPTHAVLGYWLEELSVKRRSGLPTPVLTWADLRPHLTNLEFVECTDFAGQPTWDFARAQDDASTHLPPNRGRRVLYAVDVSACRGLGIGPLEQDDQDHALTAYLDAVVKDCKPLKLAALAEATMKPGQQPIGLGDIYVDLDLVTTIPKNRSFKQHLESPSNFRPGGPGVVSENQETPEREQRRVPLLEALAQLPTLVLLGPPGAGKSTFVAYVALSLAQARLGQGDIRRRLGEWWGQGPLVPVRVTLRKFAATLSAQGEGGRAKDLWEFLRKEFENSGLPAKTFEAVQKTAHDFGALFLLDGLDEARDGATRVRVLHAVLEFAKTAGTRSRFLLTSRPYGWQDIEDAIEGAPALAEALQGRFSRWGLGDFGPDQIQTFTDRWFAAIQAAGWINEPEARAQAANLKQAVQREEYLRLARIPLLLTLMATLLASRKRLPEDRTDLYDSVVELLLLRWNEAIGLDRGLLETLKIDTLRLSDVRGAMERVAFEAHAAQQGREGVADIAEATLVAELRELLDKSSDKAEIVLDYIEQRAGLLLGQGTRRGLRQYTFPHRTIQEFLAGCHLANLPDLNDEVVRLAEEDPRHWREVLRFASRRAGPSRGLLSADGLVHRQDVEVWRQQMTPRDRDWERAILAGEMLLEIGLAAVKRQDRDGVIKTRVAGWLARLVNDGHLPVPDRAAAGVALGHLGDPRKGVGLTPDGLPDIDWIKIPAGDFLMGEERQPVTIPQEYRISRYPVTVAQYGAFVKAGGYDEGGRKYWTESGWAWRTKENVQGPEDYGALYQTANHPRVGVSWYEVVAFCRWLSEVTGQEVRLPSEVEWERAARHTDGREYPWGNAGEPKDHCNMNETGIGHTSAVGMFPSGNAVCGAADMAGNVLEWCRTKADHPKDDELEGNESRVLRGGSWDHLRDAARCAARYWGSPAGRYGLYGFRVVASPFS